jgi:DNA-binding IclR family transcriptional regulator
MTFWAIHRTRFPPRHAIHPCRRRTDPGPGPHPHEPINVQPGRTFDEGRLMLTTRLHGSAYAQAQPTTAPADSPTVPPAAACTGRGVLDGAFAVLEALADTEDGLGLTALAGASGLAKTSAYRLAEQLVALGAVQRVDHRYYIGARIGLIGQRWQPDPLLRRTAQAPVHTLAVRSCATASLRILHEDSLRVICTTAPHGHAYLPNPADRESTARTSTGRVLYATTARTDGALPGCWTPRQWRQLRACIRDMHATVVDHQEAFPGICCVSAPVWWPNGTCAGAVTAVLQAAKPAPHLGDLVVCAARSIGARLR